MSVSNPYSTSFKLQQQQQHQKSSTQAYRPKSVKRSSANLTLLADGLGPKKEISQAQKANRKQDDISIATLGAWPNGVGLDRPKHDFSDYAPDHQVAEAAKIKGNYPTSLPFIVPQADGNSTLSLVAKESIYSGAFKAKLNIPRPVDEVFDMPIFNCSGERVLVQERLTVFQFPIHLPLAKATRPAPASKMRPQSAPSSLSALIANGSQGDGRSLTSYLQKDTAQASVPGVVGPGAQPKEVAVQNKSPIVGLGEGKIGRLLRHQSGRVSLVLNNGIQMSLIQGKKPDFAEVLYSLDTQKQAAHALGPILGRGTFAVSYLESD